MMFGRLFTSKSKKHQEQTWPVFPVNLSSRPKFLFILTPPCSGSTMLAKVFNTIPGSMLLHPKAEGLWLVPGSRSPDRWDPDFCLNWDSIRSIWLKRIEFVQRLVGNISLVIEKSPILSVRASALRSAFPEDYILVLNRDPTVSCSSFFHRYNDPAMSNDEKQSEFRVLAQKWVHRSRMLREAAERFGLPRIRYEDFCADPTGSVLELARKIPILKDVDTQSQIKVKDYPLQKIEDQNSRQLSWLKPSDRQAIQSVLSQHSDLLEYFGYGDKQK